MEPNPFKDKAIYDWPFPEEMYGQVIEGIDVAILSADSLRIMAALAQTCELSAIQLKVFRRCREELLEVVPHLSAYAREYFVKLLEEVEQTLKRLVVE